MILYSKWLSLPLSVRNDIAQRMKINRSGAIEVNSNVVKSDGYAIQDVEMALSVPCLQVYLDVDTNDHEALFMALVSMVEAGQHPTPTVAKSAMSVLPPEEAKQFKKEHKERMKKSPIVKPVKVKKEKKDAKTKK